MQDPTQPPLEEEPDNPDGDKPPEQKEKETKNKVGGGAAGASAEAVDNADKPTTPTTGATSAAANTIKNNLENTITVGAPSHSDMDQAPEKTDKAPPPPNPVVQVAVAPSPQKIIPPAIVNHPPAFHLDHNPD